MNDDVRNMLSALKVSLQELPADPIDGELSSLTLEQLLKREQDLLTGIVEAAGKGAIDPQLQQDLGRVMEHRIRRQQAAPVAAPAQAPAAPAAQPAQLAPQARADTAGLDTPEAVDRLKGLLRQLTEQQRRLRGDDPNTQKQAGELEAEAQGLRERIRAIEPALERRMAAAPAAPSPFEAVTATTPGVEADKRTSRKGELSFGTPRQKGKPQGTTFGSARRRTLNSIKRALDKRKKE